MISNTEVQLLYNDLYVQMRKYIWDFDAVCALADLEEAAYHTCVDMAEVNRALRKLRSTCYAQILEDEELKAAFDAFDDIADETETYAKLYQVKEVIQHDEDFESNKD